MEELETFLVCQTFLVSNTYFQMDLSWWVISQLSSLNEVMERKITNGEVEGDEHTGNRQAPSHETKFDSKHPNKSAKL